MDIKQGVNGKWNSHWVFVLAAVGSAVGLGNIWKFPYITGENGGGAFVLLYLICLVLIGIPIMMAELMLGKRGRMSPINAMLHLARESQVSRWWASIGWLGVLAGILILSFYSVIAGWSLHYIMLAISGLFFEINAEASGDLFSGLLGNAGTLTAWHTLFLLITLGIVAAGVIKGLGVAVRYLMSLLFVLLLVLLIYSVNSAGFVKGLDFLFNFSVNSITWDSVLIAMGHAFFTLSLGMGAIMAYGAYLPDNAAPMKSMSIGKMVLIIAALDTFIALMAGLIIFPIVFSTPGIDPGQGPGLLFVSLPVAFGNMLAGDVFAAVFFFLVFVAALSSAISLIEPTVAWLVESKNWSRFTTTMLLGVLIWLVGLGTVFSFNIWSDVKLFDRTFFDSLDFLTTNIMLPFGGLLIAFFVGWIMKPAYITEEIGDVRQGYCRWWYFILRYISPLLLAFVFVMALIK